MAGRTENATNKGQAPARARCTRASPIFPRPRWINDIHMNGRISSATRDARLLAVPKKLPIWERLIFSFPCTLKPASSHRGLPGEVRQPRRARSRRSPRSAPRLDIPSTSPGLKLPGGSIARVQMALPKGRPRGGLRHPLWARGNDPARAGISRQVVTQVIRAAYCCGFNPNHLMLSDGSSFFLLSICQGCQGRRGEAPEMPRKVTEQVRPRCAALPAGIYQRSRRGPQNPDWLWPTYDLCPAEVCRRPARPPLEVPIPSSSLGRGAWAASTRRRPGWPRKCGPDINLPWTGRRLAPARGLTSRRRRNRHPAGLARHFFGLFLISGGAPRALRRTSGSPTRSDLVVAAGGIRMVATTSAQCLAAGFRTEFAMANSALNVLNCNKEIPCGTELHGHGRPCARRAVGYHCHTGRCPAGSRNAGIRDCATPP